MVYIFKTTITMSTEKFLLDFTFVDISLQFEIVQQKTEIQQVEEPRFDV